MIVVADSQAWLCMPTIPALKKQKEPESSGPVAGTRCLPQSFPISFIHPSIHLLEAESLIGARHLARLAGSGDPPLHLSTCSTPELLCVWQSTLFTRAISALILSCKGSQYSRNQWMNSNLGDSFWVTSSCFSHLLNCRRK